MTLKATAIGALIPHAGAMCLLDEVVSWTEEEIVCSATNHRAADHPLREDDRLPAVCGVEYAGQAMAVHGALVLQRAVGAGFLAGVRELKLHVDRLDNIGPTLIIEARRLLGGNEGMVYEFKLRDAGKLLISGRATVALRPD
ncbi:MAG TPA: 3-hydroxylacyl-ACP dehydratase [Burkholderiales bacterium]